MLIFLDIDGVLNRESDWKHPYTLHTECLKHFMHFCKEINGQIVLVSSWRKGYIEAGEIKNSPQIKQLEQIFAKNNIKIIGKTPELNGRSRDKEIERYLYFNPTNQYIILDDDKKEYEEISKHNYFVNEKIGFSKQDIKGAKKCILC